MEEQVKEQTVIQEDQGWNRDRAFTLSRALWRDFGPLVVGALVLIVVLVGGWTLFKKNTNSNNNPQEKVVDQQAASDVTLPESTINLGGSPSPTPTATPLGGVAQASPTATPSSLAMGETKGGQPVVQQSKGGQTLPKTGPEEIFGFLSLASVAGGYYLHKKSKKIL